MRRFSFLLAIGVLTFIIGVTAATVWTIKRHSTNNRPANTLSVESSGGLCDLIRNPDRFESRQVHVAANLIGFHEIALYGATCKQEENYVRADFDVASRQKLVEGIGRLNGAGFHRGNFWAHVILSGRFEKLVKDPKSSRQPAEDHKLIEFRYRLRVSEVESVTAVTDDALWW